MSVMIGSDIQCYINGKLLGAVSAFSFNSDTAVKTIVAVDSLLPFELAPTATAVTGNVSLFRLTQDGGLEGAGITTSFDNIARQQYLTIALKQRSTDQIIFEARYCSVINQAWQVLAKSLVTGTFVFKGIIWNTEASTLAG